MNFCIIGTSTTSIKMFIDFYRTIYLRSLEPKIVTLNSLNSSDILEGIIEESLSTYEDFRFFTVKVKRNYSNDNLPASLIESSDLVIRLDYDSFEPECIKVPENLRPIIERWVSNLERMSNT